MSELSTRQYLEQTFMTLVLSFAALTMTGATLGYFADTKESVTNHPNSVRAIVSSFIPNGNN